ncbi:MAG: anti-sigma factor, partial [Micrococcales bacterium]|nr:anti-sigma factor [Micrococcales bacterium]
PPLGELPTRLPRHRTGRGRLGRWGVGLVAAAAVALVAIVWSPWRNQPVGPPDGTATTQQSGQQVAMAVVSAPDAKSYRFKTLPATVIRSDSMGKAVLSADATMPAAPSGKAYQIWFKNAQGSFASAGMMPDNPDGPVLLTGDAAAAVGVGVTVEPATGSPHPTTTPLGLVPLT